MRNQYKLISKSLLVALASGALFVNACSSDDDSGGASGAGGKSGSGGKANGGSSGRAGGSGRGGSAGLETAGAAGDVTSGGNAGAAGEGEAGMGGEAGTGNPPIPAIEHYSAALIGAQEVPPVDSTATGSATFSYDPATRILSWMLTQNVVAASAAHIHNAVAGVSNPTPLITLVPTTPASGTATLTAEQETELRMGHLYVNVHSPTHTGGEIRGQILVTGSQLWVAKLTGPEAGTASTAVGTASLIVNAAHTSAHYRMDSPLTPTLAHIHTGITGVPGGVRFPFTLSGMSAEGDLADFAAADYTTLANGMFYVNVHTSTFAGGEIRGQLIEPGEHIYAASLNGANEVPSVTTSATGQIQFILNAAGNTLRYQSSVMGLVDATLAHIHLGSTGGIVYPLTLVGLNPTGAQAVTAGDITALNTSLYYANIHSTAQPGGEIRGTIVAH